MEYSFLKILHILLIIFNIVNSISMELLSEDVCDVDNAQALVEWYSQVYKFIRINQNLTHEILQLNNKVLDMKTLLEENLRALREQQLKYNSNENEIVIQRRQDGSVDFERSWEDYKQGFGDRSGEFFIGLEKLHKLTNSRPYELLVIMEDWQNQRRYAKYDNFVIGSELEKFELQSLGSYKGTAGDSLSYHLSYKFSTKDQDNSPKNGNCAMRFRGAWWHNACHLSNLNGLYLNGTIGGTQWAQGVIWKTFKDYTYSLKFVEMLLIKS